VIFRRPRSSQSPSRQAEPAARDQRHSRALSSLFEGHNRTLQSFLMARLGNQQEAQRFLLRQRLRERRDSSSASC
jgi:hypothetical protein